MSVDISFDTYSIFNEQWRRAARLRELEADEVEIFCGAERDRTDDLRLAKPALSQLSYSPRCVCQNGYCLNSGPGQS